MIRRPPRSTRTDTLFPYTTLYNQGAAPRYALQTAGSAAKCPLHFGQIRLPGCALRKISPQPPKHGRSRTTATGVDSASDHFSMTLRSVPAARAAAVGDLPEIGRAHV